MTAGVRGLFAADAPFFLIAGPCLLEDDALNLCVAESLARTSEALGLPVLFKASFDKANRSRPDAPRGPGLEEGLARLAAVGRETGLPTLTDVHEPSQAAAAAEVCAALQVPAFLSRQTDLVEAAAATGRPVNLKKGQWMAPEDMAGAVAKARAAGAAGVAVTERGTFFGYGDLVVDMRAFARMREATGAPVIFDGTHSVQRPGRADGASGGDPRHTPALVRAAAAAGVDGLFLEVHPEPARAPSDPTTMLPLERLAPLLRDVLAIREALGARGADVGAREAALV
ncbi:MAG TPA: 3-deoxy-8-phosphooctulonate synthase [Longimicrobiales bacterium]|nr:3-deoxy-8-phosphooctulonate synthase [Longimicrobiales bacterium]